MERPESRIILLMMKPLPLSAAWSPRRLFWVCLASSFLLFSCVKVRHETPSNASGADSPPAATSGSSPDHSPEAVPPTGPIEPLVKSKTDWQALLGPAEYDVLFEEGTERAGTSPLNGEKREGTFLCAACSLPLFESTTKYESGTGWPSFFDAIPGRLGTKEDHGLMYARTEYHCIRCGGHQGHVFEDGPPPTGLRYCNNGVALRFIPKDEKLPELRK